MSNNENVNKEERASFKPTLSRTMSVNVHENEYALSKPVMTWAYTLDTGACNDPLNGGKPSELEKIVDKKRTLQIEEEEEEEVDEDDEEEVKLCKYGCDKKAKGGFPCYSCYWKCPNKWKKRQKVDEEEEEEEEPEEGIGCNACYACVTGGCSPCIKDVNIER